MYPLAITALKRKGLRLNAWKPPDFFFFWSLDLLVELRSWEVNFNSELSRVVINELI